MEVAEKVVSGAICRGTWTATYRGVGGSPWSLVPEAMRRATYRVAGHVPCRAIGKATVHIPLPVALPAIPPAIREANPSVVHQITTGVTVPVVFRLPRPAQRSGFLTMWPVVGKPCAVTGGQP
jgi:hypothetical protein